MRLLVVEDDERVMAALGTALRRHGFEVLCSRSGAGALALLRHRPDVILLDLGLPDHDGFHVCEWIRRVSGTPIIMTTARSNFESRVQGLNLGADDYLVKPYNLAELIARIHAVSRRYGSAAAASVAAHQEKEEPEDLSPVSVGEIHIDPTQRSVEVGGRAVAFGPATRTDPQRDLAYHLAGHPPDAARTRRVAAAEAGLARPHRVGTRRGLPIGRPGAGPPLTRQALGRNACRLRLPRAAVPRPFSTSFRQLCT